MAHGTSGRSRVDAFCLLNLMSRNLGFPPSCRFYFPRIPCVPGDRKYQWGCPCPLQSTTACLSLVGAHPSQGLFVRAATLLLLMVNIVSFRTGWPPEDGAQRNNKNIQLISSEEGLWIKSMQFWSNGKIIGGHWLSRRQSIKQKVHCPSYWVSQEFFSHKNI